LIPRCAAIVADLNDDDELMGWVKILIDVELSICKKNATALTFSKIFRALSLLGPISVDETVASIKFLGGVYCDAVIEFDFCRADRHTRPQILKKARDAISKRLKLQNGYAT